MSLSKQIFLLFLILTFFIGLYVTTYWNTGVNIKNKEAMENNSEDDGCPDLLIQRDNVLLLYNTKKPEDETNPIPFFNLDEYINYLEIQKDKGGICPTLFLQQENNAQGKEVYRVRPSPFDLQGGLPTEAPDGDRGTEALNSPTYNTNQFPGFDSHGQYVGQYTNIDEIHDSTNTKKISDNPMDSKWAGITYTQQMVDSGKYIERGLTKPSFFNPKTAFYPSIPSVIPLPQDIL